MSRIDDPVFKAFFQYQDIAQNIAGECDSLLEEQREVAYFADQLRVFLSELREVIIAAERSDTGYTMRIPSDTFSKLVSELAKMESAVGQEVPQVESVPVHAHKPQQGQGLSLLARKSV